MLRFVSAGVLSISGGMLIALAIFPTVQAEKRSKESGFEEYDARIARAMHAPAQSVRVFDPRKLPPHQFFLKIQSRDLKLDPEDARKYELLSRNNVARIDFVTSRCQNDVAEAMEAVDRQRVETLERFDKWTAAPASGPSGGFSITAPVISGEVVYVGTERGELIALQMSDGQVLHRTAVGEALRFRPVIAAGRAYLGTVQLGVHRRCSHNGDLHFSEQREFRPAPDEPAPPRRFRNMYPHPHVEHQCPLRRFHEYGLWHQRSHAQPL